LLRVVAIAVTTLVGSCDSPTEPLALIPDVRHAVVGAAADALDARGRFRLPPVERSGSTPVISIEDAGALGAGYISTFVTNPNVITPAGLTSIRRVIEDAHGSVIEWNSLEPDDRIAYYAESPYEPFPDSVPDLVARYFGPFYLVPFYLDDDQPVSIAVAAARIDAWVDTRGIVHLSTPSGNEFLAQGVLRGAESRVPPWPEQAVLAVFSATGARTMEIPTLLKPGERWAPQGARWRLVLDRPITVERAADRELVTTDTIYLGVWIGPGVDGGARYGLHWYVARRDQPESEVITYRVRNGLPGAGEYRSYLASFRPGMPVHFDFVVPVR